LTSTRRRARRKRAAFVWAEVVPGHPWRTWLRPHTGAAVPVGWRGRSTLALLLPLGPTIITECRRCLASAGALFAGALEAGVTSTDHCDAGVPAGESAPADMLAVAFEFLGGNLEDEPSQRTAIFGDGRAHTGKGVWRTTNRTACRPASSLPFGAGYMQSRARCQTLLISLLGRSPTRRWGGKPIRQLSSLRRKPQLIHEKQLDCCARFKGMLGRNSEVYSTSLRRRRS